MKMNPLSNYIVVKFRPRAKELEEQASKSGLIIAQPKFEGMPDSGEVLDIGPEVKEVQVGDFIYFNDQNPTVVELDGETYQFVRESLVEARTSK